MPKSRNQIPMPRVASELEEIVANIRAYNREVTKVPSAAHDTHPLTSVMANTRAWYAVRLEDGSYQFGPSKFIGYAEITVEQYEALHHDLDGRVTEVRLQKLSEPILQGHKIHADLVRDLGKFCARFGKNPNRGARIALLHLQASQKAPSIGDDEHIRAVIAIAKRLPAEGQREVRKALAA